MGSRPQRASESPAQPAQQLPGARRGLARAGEVRRVAREVDDAAFSGRARARRKARPGGSPSERPRECLVSARPRDRLRDCPREP